MRSRSYSRDKRRLQAVTLRLRSIPVLLTIFVASFALFYFAGYWFRGGGTTIGRHGTASWLNDGHSEAAIDYTPILNALKETANHVKIDERVVSVNDLKVNYRVASPLTVKDVNPVIVLLHGISSDIDGTSQVWTQQKTIQILAAHGFQVVAPDLPGTSWSKTSKIALEDSQKSAFLSEFLDVLSVRNPIVVGASWGATFSIPYLLEQPYIHRAEVVVGPVVQDLLTEEAALKITIPVLFVQGEYDNRFGETSYKKLKHLPTLRRVVVQGAGHAVFQEAPDSFHSVLLEFLDSV